MRKKIITLLFMAIPLFISACGDSENTGPILGLEEDPTPEVVTTSIDIQSEAGDYIGQGQSYSYTQADALLTIEVTGNLISIEVEGDEHWWADFQLPNSATQLEVGLYENLSRYPFHDAAVGGLDWYGEGRGCNTLTGWFAIDSVVYAEGQVASFSLRFEQHCEGWAPALTGEILWSADDPTAPPGPVNPPPPGLWKPTAGATPEIINYVYVERDSGTISTTTYTQANSVISVNENSGYLGITIDGDEREWGDFQAMNSLARLEPGYYGDLKRYPFHNPAKGGISYRCVPRTGWFVVDNVVYDLGILVEIKLRFELECDSGTISYRGEIYWNANDTTAPPDPVNPPPADLWTPAPGDTPATGNYVYLISDAGDYVGQGNTYTYIGSEFNVSTDVGYMSIVVNSTESWYGDFKTMNTLSQLEPGYYPDLRRFPFHNPVKGGLDWSGEGRGCNQLSGWFVVDSVTYVGNVLTAVDLRFEQHCEMGATALRGQIYWVQ